MIILEAYYFFFQSHQPLANCIQQVIANDPIVATTIMNQHYHGKWCYILNQSELELAIKNQQYNNFEFLPPLYDTYYK